MSSDLDRLERAAKSDPAALIRLADTLVASGRAEDAVAACRKGLAQRPDDVALRLALGRALSAAGHLEEAQAALLDAVSRQKPAAPAPHLESEPIQTRPDATQEEIEHDITDDEPTRAGSRAKMPSEWHSDPQPGARPHHEPNGQPTGPVDLERVAHNLLIHDHATGDEQAPPAPVDPKDVAWAQKRARAFVWLWVSLVLVAGGIAGGWIWKAAQKRKMLADMVAKADARLAEATYEGDAAARDAFAHAVRADMKSRKFFAMVAYAAARLHADQGDDTDAAAWAMLRRSEREAQKHKPDPDARTERELRQARALLALGRGETCPQTELEDGDIAARCVLQKGDVEGARKQLDATIKQGGDAANLRALLALGSLELGAGDLDAADAAFRRVLQVSAKHPRAIVGRALVQIERGEAPKVEIPEGRLGPTVTAWFHLARGLAAPDDAKMSAELDLARKAIVHDGRLALLYGRARLQQGKVGESEQAMRIAERLDPNDPDVAVLDAEVALAKGFEEKVALALTVGPPTPRKLSVLGRAQVLVGKYREAAATLDAALARRPGDATAVTYRAIARAKLGDQSGAIKELEKAATQLASSTPRYGLGLIAYERRDLTKAKNELSRALERNSESFRARALLGRVLRDMGRPKEALTELEKVARDAPALAQVQSALARLYLDLGRSREARSALRKVVDAGKATPDDKAAYAEATAELGLVADAEQAVTAAQEAGVLGQKLARTKLVILSWKGPKEAAVAAKALEKERRGSAAHDARLAIQAANAWRRAGDLKKAGDDLRAALLGDALHANLGLGRVDLASNDYVQAEGAFRAALQAWEKGPYGEDDRTEARVGLARVLYVRKALPEMIKILQECLTDDPQAPEPHYWLARAHQDQGDVDKARAQADKASELDDAYADAFLLVGDLNKGQKDKSKAKKAYQRFLELQPDSPQAKKVKQAIAQLK
jgi:predicted Zn-dependent protease